MNYLSWVSIVRLGLVQLLWLPPIVQGALTCGLGDRVRSSVRPVFAALS